MRFRVLLLGLASLVLLATACLPAPQLRNDNLLQDTSLITGDPCEAPCWRGIIPGETDWNDALDIIEDSDDFTELTTETVENDTIIRAVWQQGEDGESCCQMFSSEDGEIVNIIFLQRAPVMVLSEVIEVWGDPDYVVGVEFSADQAIMNLFYVDVPMVLYVFLPGTEEGELTEDSEIIGTLYITPDDINEILETNNLHVWEGYQSYTAYEEGEFEVTPIATPTPEAEEG